MDKMFELASHSRKLHYMFAYRMLPLMLFGEYGHSVWEVLKDPDANGVYLLEAWERTAVSQQCDLFEPIGLKATFRSRDEGRDMVVIKMPEPQYPPEAYYGVIQFDPLENQLHYYTIEYSVRLDGSRRVVLGKILKGGQRHNLGALPNTDLELGLDEIERKSSHLFPFRTVD